ncbi:transketolase [Gemmatimonas sp.]|uniref:transketolase n=1 Tax=Gemmatimonas sp. TaxID=1962908 RepID=UPI0022C27568|nr:transketolase [Gemmatimonas sp.]MCE2952699.1 transketolase [Gemmatimonas sp.]MCZ8010871.1 transketolase [Gemmatimonas sp.]MCZ8266309.1 transketolase [Gemmatimonas sp.]
MSAVSPLLASASPETVRLAIDTVRTLAMDAVQAAESGHPGTPMALAPLAYALYATHLRHDPAAPAWVDRDRFVLSVGHASMLLYGSLHLAGYDLPLEEIRNFRQWESLTPGHPEVHHTKGVETTTGPLGQGIANAVGFAVAEASLAATFNRPGHQIVDHYTYFIAGDGCLMEGISHEAASFAGHMKLGKLIGFFDDNGITIDGSTALTCSDDAAQRFAAYGWQVLQVDDVNDLAAIDAAIAEAKADTERPTLIITKTHIGFGSPNRQDSAKAHGEPLGKDEIALTKAAYGWPSTEPFFVPADALAHWREAAAQRAATHTEWKHTWQAYEAAHPELAREFERRMKGELPPQLEQAFPVFDAKSGAVASRAASGAVINAIAGVVPELLGGSADLTGSNLTNVKGAQPFSAAQRDGRNFHFGIREHAMGAIMNGMGLHGGVIPYGGTFLVFSDYMRPAIRLAALMGVQAIYVFTHDSIGLGEDGPTHQPIEHLAALRCIPNLLVLRPADADEVSEAWRTALHHRSGPSAIVLTRQKLAYFGEPARARDGVKQGAYIVADAAGHVPHVVLLASGSEVDVALTAREQLSGHGVRARVVSCTSLERFAQQPVEYRHHVLPTGVPRVAVEAAHPMSWYRWVGDHGAIVGIESFGASAPAPVLFEKFGISADRVVQAARTVLA